MILLDTHAWVWWLTAPERVGNAARSAIDDAVGRGGALVSSIRFVPLATADARLRNYGPVRTIW